MGWIHFKLTATNVVISSVPFSATHDWLTAAAAVFYRRAVTRCHTAACSRSPDGYLIKYSAVTGILIFSCTSSQVGISLLFRLKTDVVCRKSYFCFPATLCIKFIASAPREPLKSFTERLEQIAKCTLKAELSISELLAILSTLPSVLLRGSFLQSLFCFTHFLFICSFCQHSRLIQK